MSDTIVAIATAPGPAGLAVVRTSGPDAITLANAVFQGNRSLAEAPSHSLLHGWAVECSTATHPSEIGVRRIDEVVMGVFRAPRSFTGEHLVEISCHGGTFSAARVVEALVRAGARPARPGEFTLRAFLNAKLDLVQAEAVADVIHAESESAHLLAVSQLAGELSRRLSAITERIADALAEVEARVDFAEDVGGIEVPESVCEAIAAAERDLSRLLEGSGYARALREGVRIPIVGRPNAGKSSLFNALLGEERAIVTDVPGTTRDRVSESMEIAGVRLTLSDTAGLRESAEAVESIGISRTRELIHEAPVVIWVVDGSEPLTDEDRTIGATLAGKNALAALNKRDRLRAVGVEEIGAIVPRVVEVSAARGDGIGALKEALAVMLGAGGREGALGSAVANPRHVDALGRARAGLARAAEAARAALPGEIVALELRECVGAIGEVTGRSVTEDLLERIFSRFCIGK